MRPPRLLALGALTLGCLTGSVTAQYYPTNPYGYYPQHSYAAYPAYSQPMYGAPMYQPYQAPAYQQPVYYPQAAPVTQAPTLPVPQLPSSDPIVVMPDSASANNGPRLPPAPRSSLPAIPTSAQRHKTLSQPIEVVPDVSVISPAPVAIGTTCGDACAKSCDPVANSLRRWYGQVGAVLLRPTWSDNTAFLSQSATGANSSQDLEYDWTVMPRGEFGFQCCGGFGMRARYMYFNDTSQTAAVTTPAGGSFSSAAPLGIRDASATAGDTATAFGTLLFHLGDIEFQQEFRWGCWSLRGSAGGRFAYVDQDYTYGRISGGVATAGLLSESQFIGGGPTIALEGRRYFPRVHTAVYGIGRASLLWGRAEETVSGTAGTAVRNEDLTLPMFDFEAGFEWWVDIHRVRLFAQLGVIGQVWYGLGNSSNSSPNFTSGATGVGGLPGFEANANSRRDMTLLGVTLSVGIQF